MRVDVSSSSPILRMEVETDCFGELFASMSSDEQVEVLRSILSYMSDHPLQWDYIAIELEKEDNADLLRSLKSIVIGMGVVE